MVRGRLRTRRTVVNDPGRVGAGGSGGWSGIVCGLVVRRLPKSAQAAAESDDRGQYVTALSSAAKGGV
jgi:hypothetical protein